MFRPLERLEELIFRSIKISRILWGWAFYDFANTIFSAVVQTFYFPLYLTQITGKNLYLGISTTLAMILAGLVVPWLGAVSDRTGKTKFYLVISTLLCVIATSLLSLFVSPLPLIAGFLTACFFYHASLVFYSALLPVAAEPDRQGFASGVGTGLGYLGVLFAMPVAHWVDSFLGRPFVFITASILFLLFSIPLFLWTPERKVEHPLPATLNLFLQEWKRVFQTIGSLKNKPEISFFFLGNFLVVDAVNTVIFWLVIYMSRVFHLPQSSLLAVFLTLNFSAFLFGFIAGFLTDRFGSSRVYIAAAASLFVTILVLGLTNEIRIFLTMAFFGGSFGFAGIWTAARKRVVELAPREAVGEYFGLYNLTTKISVIGSLIFSLLADGFGFHTALLSQSVTCGAGLLFLIIAGRRTGQG